MLEKEDDIDMVICMYNVGDKDVFSFASELKSRQREIPFVLLTHFSKEIYRRLALQDTSAVDYMFSWHGNADLIVAIIKLFEDLKNADDDILGVGVQAILLVEDSVRYYSTYLPELYKLVLKQSSEFLKETLNEQQRKFRKRYSDIYDLLEEIFKKELNEIVAGGNNTTAYIEGLTKVANVAYSHKKLINNICSSRSYEYLENYLYKSCKPIMIDVVSNAAKGLDVPDEDVEFIASFYEYAWIGVISEWFRTGMREPPAKIAGQLWLVMDGIRRALRKSAKRHAELSE